MKKVILVGTGEGWKFAPKQAPDTDTEIWGINGVRESDIKLDKLFMMDVLDECPPIVSEGSLEKTIKQINEIKVPLIAPFKYHDIPLSEAYPLEAVKQKFGVMYFSNTVCFAIAYALLNEAEKLDLFGINQTGSEEYLLEKAGVEYWLGLARGLGVEVLIHGGKTSLLRNLPKYGGENMYGYFNTYEEVLKHQQRFGMEIKKLL